MKEENADKGDKDEEKDWFLTRPAINMDEIEKDPWDWTADITWKCPY